MTWRSDAQAQRSLSTALVVREYFNQWSGELSSRSGVGQKTPGPPRKEIGQISDARLWRKELRCPLVGSLAGTAGPHSLSRICLQSIEQVTLFWVARIEIRSQNCANQEDQANDCRRCWQEPPVYT